MKWSGWYRQNPDGSASPVAEPRFTPASERQVAVTTVRRPDGSHVIVSTVFLAFDHGWGEGPPVLWETMVFRAASGEVADFRDLDMDRYTSRADALAGHEAMVARWREGREEGSA